MQPTVFFIVRAVIGEIDDEADSNMDMSNIRADPLNPVVYWNFPARLIHWTLWYTETSEPDIKQNTIPHNQASGTGTRKNLLFTDSMVLFLCGVL